MDIERYIIVKKEIERCRAIGVGESVAYLLSLLEGASSPDEASSVIQLIISEYRELNDLDGQEWALRKAVEIDNEHPYPLTSLAEFIFYNRANLTDALVFAHRAVELAAKLDVAPIHTLNVQARIARKARDWTLFGNCLRHLMASFGKAAGPDIAYERDFMVRLPRSAPDKLLYKEYSQFIDRRQALRGDTEVYRNLADLQMLEWLALSDRYHIAEPEDLLLLDRCRRVFDSDAPIPDAGNWREILEDLISQSRLHVSLVDQILVSFQADAATIGKSLAGIRARESVKRIKGEELQHMAMRAVEFLSRDQ